jgi:hypothetical protein
VKRHPVEWTKRVFLFELAARAAIRNNQIQRGQLDAITLVNPTVRIH